MTTHQWKHRESAHGSRESLRVVIVYLTTAALWILFSDKILMLLLPHLDPDTISAGQTVKGLLFVLATAGMLYALVVRSIRRVAGMNERMAESEEKYRTLFHTVRDGLCLLKDDVIVECNQEASTLFGIPRDNLLGRSPWDLSPARQPDGTPSREKAEHHISACRSGSTLFFEWLHTREGGEHFVVDVGLSCFSLRGEAFILASLRDITDRKKNEFELQKAKERSERSDHLKDLFLANVSHEIRTPLNLITGYAGLIEAHCRPQTGEEVLTYFHGLDHGCRRLLYTVEQLVSISTLQAGLLEVQPSLVRPAQIISTLLQRLRDEATRKGLELRFVNECADMVIHVDPFCFEKALANILDNAIKFTNSGSVILRQQCNATTYSVHITDTGIGMTEDYQKNIFTLFSQEVEGYTRPYQGLGLGLALSKRYADMIGASLTFSSVKDQGSTFTVTIPVRHVSEPPIPAYLNSDSLRPSTFSKSEPLRHLLVVEDDPLSQELVRALLSREYQLSFAASSDEAWSLLDMHRIDAVLMDLSIQGHEDGLQLTQKIRESDRICEIPIVVITAHSLPEDRDRCFAARCNHYFAKPFNASELRRVLSQLLTS